MPKNKILLNKFMKLIHKYGVNAILGFALGILLVLFCLMIFEEPGGSSIKAPKDQMVESTDSRNSGGQEISGKHAQSVEGENSSFNQESNEISDRDPIETAALKDNFTVLLVGVDNRPDEKSISNTDSLIVVSFNQKNKKMVFLSIPRDTQVMLTNQTKEKVNALARLGNGVSSTKKGVEEIIGTPIEGYVLTSFQGFKNIIDNLGGITVNVEKNMFFDTGDNQDRIINLKKGKQRLNGTQALQYARFRNDELADISRTSRQQVILKAIVAEATEPRNLPRLPFLIPKIYQSIQTDLNISQLWSLTLAVKNREKYEVVSQTLPGKFSIEEGISYWKVDSKQARQILNKLFTGVKSPVFNSENTSAKDESKNKIQLKKDTSSRSSKGENEGITFEVISP